MIQVTDLHKTYGNKKNTYDALNGINLTINDGESVAIVGKSGSGKSTLMHVMAALDTPTSGSVQYEGKNLANYNARELNKFRNENIGFVFQQFFLKPNQNVFENISLPLMIKGISANQRHERVLQVLKEVDMEDKKKNKATDLSGGQKQRVCIARALINNPKIIFADEPTGNLDSTTGKTIIDLLFKLNKEKHITLIIVTHDDDIAKMCDRRIYIQDGKILNHENT